MKKFITIALAVAVLFSFAACQNQAPVTGLVSRIVATQTETYVVGEKATPSGFSYVGYTTLGTEVSISASEITFTGNTVIDGTTDSINYLYQGQPGSIDVEAEYVTGIVSVDVSGLPTLYETPKYEDLDGNATVISGRIEREIDPELITAVVTYGNAGEQKTVTLTDATLSNASEFDFSAAGEATLTVSFASGDVAPITKTVDVTVAENLITGVTLAQTEDYELYYGNPGNISPSVPSDGLTYATGVGTASETDGVYVSLTYTSGEVVLLDEDAATGTLVEWTAAGEDTDFDSYEYDDYRRNRVAIGITYGGTEKIGENLDRTPDTIDVTQTARALVMDTLKITGYINNADEEISSNDLDVTFTVKYNDPGLSATPYVVDNLEYVGPEDDPTDEENYFSIVDVEDIDISDNVQGDRVTLTFEGAILDTSIPNVSATLIVGTDPSV